MLSELKIENLAIIDKLDLDFDKGFIVLTGETGAGKSIILSAINLLIGEKASLDMIRDGKEYLLAQGVFDITDEQAKKLERFDIDVEDNQVIVRRQLNINGKAKIYVNNIRVSLTELKEIMSELVDIVGQHSHQMLLNKNNHLHLLDSFLDKEAKEIKIIIQDEVKKIREYKKQITDLEKNREEILQKKDFYEFQLEELNKLHLKENEEEELELEYKRLFNAGQIKDSIDESLEILRDGDVDFLSNLQKCIGKIEDLVEYNEDFNKIVERLNNSYYEIEDCLTSLDNFNFSIDIDENELNKVGKRLDKLNTIRKKYGKSISELIDYKKEIETSLSQFELGFFDMESLSKKIKEREEIYTSYAEKLSLARKEVAKNLEASLEKELKFLNMDAAKLKIDFKKREGIDTEGFDDIEFLISTNVGQNLKPLSKIASGGEVSRIMLALKVIFSKVDKIPILIFDEIDTGVGGETVKKIADKLREIGTTTQVISITHSPAIAAVANQQFYIQKTVKENSTTTTVKLLDFSARVQEIARMLVGDNASQDALDLAEKMLKE